jgi:acyl-CoA thioesterase FadM
MVEAALIVSEAAVDYLNPAVNKTEVTANTKPQVVSSRKVDRIIDISQKTGRVIYHGGSKVGYIMIDVVYRQGNISWWV